MSGLKMMDFFRKIPADLTETTITGAALSVAACIFMGVLFIVELYAFLSTTVETGVMLDTNSDTLLRINFNVTMLDLQCDYAAVDVVDVLGTNSMNVTKNVEKWQLDEHGKRMIFQGRNREQKAISYEEHHPETVEEMMANGIHAQPLTEGGFEEYVQSHPYAFINFYAPWCIWCQRLEPTWERLAEAVAAFDHQEGHASLKVGIGKVDVPGNMEVGTSQGIRAFPTMRLFKKGESVADYREDRTVEALLKWLKQKVDFEARTREWEKSHGAQFHNDQEEHPGCMLSGFVLVRVCQPTCRIVASTSTPSTRRLLDGVAVWVLYPSIQSTEK